MDIRQPEVVVVAQLSQNGVNFCEPSAFKKQRIAEVRNYNSHKKSNKMQQCIKILFHIYMKFNMFRATHRPSSRA
jgi:hypothetical protein